MTLFTKNQQYTFNQIEDNAQSLSDITIDEHGREVIGEHFLVVDSPNMTYSFVLVGGNTSGYVYECVFAG